MLDDWEVWWSGMKFLIWSRLKCLQCRAFKTKMEVIDDCGCAALRGSNSFGFSWWPSIRALWGYQKCVRLFRGGCVTDYGFSWRPSIGGFVGHLKCVRLFRGGCVVDYKFEKNVLIILGCFGGKKCTLHVNMVARRCFGVS